VTLQNRVAPTGEILADPARGLLMGNRGCLHDSERRLGVSRWRSAAWISCVLDWKGVRRDVMPPGGWTALFFLDEVTALAAGHRPCGYCRRSDFRWFARCWQEAHRLSAPPRAPAMDHQLQAERVDRRTRRQQTRTAMAGQLPGGVMIRDGDQLGLLADGALRPWSFAGYLAPQRISPGREVELLTPPASVAVLTAGYRPLVHPSAGATPLRALDSC
jgi:hypothetical protein